MFEKFRAEEAIREAQQGLGRPIISFETDGRRFVAVRNRLHWSPKWKTVPDFLADYIKMTVGPDWGNTEIARPLGERHPIMQWYDAVCRYQAATIKIPGQVSEVVMTGIVMCYLGLAYNLYLLDHNAELQERLVRRLKDPANFQGAYYELIVAGILIRAGFTLTLEDETDGASKHCEFAAVSKRTGKKYWVEAKMRAVSGLLGKTDRDGTSDPNPISHLIPHLNNALRKPAADDRLIFIDLNTSVDVDTPSKPRWIEAAVERLERYEKDELKTGHRAYVFVTNFPAHRMLDKAVSIGAVPFGLGMPDFNRPGYRRLSEAYRRKLKHFDAYDIGESLQQYPHIPSTFDGSLPSETFDKRSSRVLIGHRYVFGEGAAAEVQTVTSTSVIETEKRVYVGTAEGKIWAYTITDEELADYRRHPDAYFGRVEPVSRKIDDPFEFFEWLIGCNKETPKEKLLEFLSGAPDIEALREMSQEDLSIEYCERVVAWSGRFKPAA